MPTGEVSQTSKTTAEERKDILALLEHQGRIVDRSSPADAAKLNEQLRKVVTWLAERAQREQK